MRRIQRQIVEMTPALGCLSVYMAFQQVPLEGQDLPCTYLARHEVIIIMIIIIIIVIFFEIIFQEEEHKGAPFLVT